MGKDKYLAPRDEQVVLAATGFGDQGGYSLYTSDLDQEQRNAQERRGLLHLDVLTEANAGLRRQTKDRDLINPRHGAGPQGPEQRHVRHLLPDEKATPVSQTRIRRENSRRIQAQKRMTPAERRDYIRFLSDPALFESANRLLAETLGDIDHESFSPKDRALTKRMDRAIRKGEELNDHYRVAYINMRIPPGAGSLQERTQRWFEVGQHLQVDHFLVGSLNLHEARRSIPPESRDDTLTIAYRTKRGIYAGRAHAKDDATIVLPRGLTLRIKDVFPTTSIDRESVYEGGLVVQSDDATFNPASPTFKNAAQTQQ